MQLAYAVLMLANFLVHAYVRYRDIAQLGLQPAAARYLAGAWKVPAECTVAIYDLECIMIDPIDRMFLIRAP